MVIHKDKALGMLLGLHCGDSLGATLEFKNSSKHPNFHTEITGGGMFNWKPGAPTDDTEMMVCLLHSLVRNNGVFSAPLTAKYYIAWVNTNPPDIGSTVRRGIYKLEEGIYDDGDQAVNSQANGSIMRCAPLALFYKFDDLELVSHAQAKMTHGHPLCLKLDYIYLTTLSIILNYDLSIDNILGHVIEYCKRANLYDFSEQVRNIRNVPWSKLKTTGYVWDTFYSALWGLVNTNSAEEAIISVVNRGDDADTCGAVTGALVGAYYGKHNLPIRWLNTLDMGIMIKDLVELSYITMK